MKTNSSRFINLKAVLKVVFFSYLFIAYDKHIDLLMENSEVLITDLIYKINMF